MASFQVFMHFLCNLDTLLCPAAWSQVGWQIPSRVKHNSPQQIVTYCYNIRRWVGQVIVHQLFKHKYPRD